MAFDRCVAFTLAREGGFTNDPRDPGNWTGGKVGVGALKGTKFGISAASYPDLDIIDLTEEQAEAIYQRDFWRKLYADFMAPGTALMVFDEGVNAGISRSAKIAQHEVGAVVDGVVGQDTLELINKATDTEMVGRLYVAQGAFYKALPNFAIEGKGWMRRLDLRFAEAKEMASGA